MSRSRCSNKRSSFSKLFAHFYKTNTYTRYTFTRSSDKYEIKKQICIYIYILRPILSSHKDSFWLVLRRSTNTGKSLEKRKEHTTNNETLELLFDLDSCFDYFSAFSVNRMEVKLNERLYLLQRCSSLPTALFYCSIVLLWLVIVQL